MTSARLAVVGTRVVGCPGEEYRVAERIRRAIDVLKPEVVISGGASGVDSIAEAVAFLAGYNEAEGTLIVHRPTVKQWDGPGGYRERDQRIADDCTHLLRIACVQATTFGSGWTARQAHKHGAEVVTTSVCAAPRTWMSLGRAPADAMGV